MKKLKTICKALIILLIINACTEERSLDFLENIAPPTNVSGAYNLTQDNSGLVTITPVAEGASSFDIDLGDSSEMIKGINQGENVKHTYKEGTYQVKIIAYNAKGDATEASQELVVSFKAPENLIVTLENDVAKSRKVNITASADYAATYEFYSGEQDVEQPVLTANIEDAISYEYKNAGTYTVSIVAKGSAMETTAFNAEFEVTEILAPIAPAATPPSRADADVISVFSDAYTNVVGTNLNPDWQQQTVYSAFDLNGDAIIQYSNLNYQGIQIGDGGSSQDLTAMEFLHLDVWTADAVELSTFLISQTSGEKSITTALNKDEWTSITIPISDFTDQGLSVADIHQFKFEGAGTVFIDNLYFWKAPSATSVLAGTWKVAPEAGSLKVGPSQGSGEWFSISDAQVAERACYYDDEYVFEANFTFKNVLGNDTWIEGWQGANPESCGTPVAPHDGTSAATYTHDLVNNKVTLSGNGAYLGLPKVNNVGELPNVAVPSSITYDITLSNNNTEMIISIEAGSGVFWTYKLIKDAGSAPAASPVNGTWKVAAEEGSLKVGPSFGSGEWFAISDAQIAERACYFDDEYVFNVDGSFVNELGSETWLEGWQTSSSDACGAPIAPHNNSNPATFVYDASTSKITLNGQGAYIGLPKVNNVGELPAVEIQDSIVYDVALSNNNTEMVLTVEAGSGVFWTFKLVKQ